MSSTTSVTQGSVGKRIPHPQTDVGSIRISASPAPTLISADQLKQGNLQLSKEKKDLNILLVGAAGVGKTSFASLLSNILSGRFQSGRRWLDVRALKDETSKGSIRLVYTSSTNNESTCSSRMYMFRSKNQVNLRILDTPGLSDVSDAHTRKNIKKHVRGQLGDANAVLILVDASAPRFDATADFILNVLTPIYSHSLMRNLGIIFTNATNKDSFDPKRAPLPEILRGIPHFFIDNPVVMQNRFQEARSEGRHPQETLNQLEKDYQDGTNKALHVLADLFHWLDGLVPLPQQTIKTIRPSLSNSSSVPNTPTTPLVEEAEAKHKPSEAVEKSPTPIQEPNNASPLDNAISRLVENRKELTILLLGEAGSGKTSFLSLLTNILTGKTSGQYAEHYDPSNEAYGPPACNHTRSAKVYEFKAANGLTLRILDTPGFADSRGLEQDARHKGEIAEAIRDHIRTVDAIFILANGSTPRFSIAETYAVSTIMTMIPTTMSKNVGIVFTQVNNPVSWGSEKVPLPGMLRDAKQFVINNPVALQKGKSPFTALGSAERDVAPVLVEMFDWVNSLSCHPGQGFYNLYRKSMVIKWSLSNVIDFMRQIDDGKQEEARLAEEVAIADAEVNRRSSMAFRHQIREKTPTPWYNEVCEHPNCCQNCDVSTSETKSRMFQHSLLSFWKGDERPCNKCGHMMRDHSRVKAVWKVRRRTTTGSLDSYQLDNAIRTKEGKLQLLEASRRKARDLEQCIADALFDIKFLTEEYAQSSLSGSFAHHVESSISLLQSNLGNMERFGHSIDRNSTSRMQGVLRHLQVQLRVLKAHEEA